jgi:hypothetical protein
MRSFTPLNQELGMKGELSLRASAFIIAPRRF